MQPFRYHVMVCTQQKVENIPSCGASGGGAILGVLYEQLGKQGLADDVIVSATGCLGACDHGPVMIVYPDATWYGPVAPADVAEIVASHLKGGKPVARLALREEGALRAEILDHRQKYFAAVAARDKAGILPDNISLHEILRGFMSSRALLTALELDVFTAVGGGGSARDLAGKLGTNERATEMLLNVLVSLGLLVKKDGRFHNTPVTARFLSGDSPDNARPGLMHNVHLWDTWSTLTECVRRGTAVAKSPSGERDPESTRAFIAAMDRNAKERAAQVVRAVANSIPPDAKGAGIERMLDVGGGSAAYSIAFAQANPRLSVELLDLPAVLPLTEEYIRRAGLESRIRTRPGDMRSDAFGQGYNLVLLSQIVHMFSPEENRDLLSRIYQALAPGGRLILQDFILEADKTSPGFAVLFSLNMLVNTQGGASYSEPEYNRWLREAGFREAKRVRMPGPANLMIATK
jgi:(2Fe-2S) ferredoxin/SAM-dependent methyltransferase